MKISAEAGEFRTAAAAARVAGRDAMESAATSKRDAALAREEVAQLSAELKRSRAACSLKVTSSEFFVNVHFFFFFLDTGNAIEPNVSLVIECKGFV